MKNLVVILMILCITKHVYGLECITCRGSSLEDCRRKSSNRTCTADDAVCETVVGRFGSGATAVVVVIKGCKNAQKCYANQNKNILKSFSSTLCNEDLSYGLCRCCCREDHCNAGGLYCLDNACQAKRRFLYGKYTCDRGNSIGSLCNASCSRPMYSIYPQEHTSATCVDGEWSNPKPCCARPCPPYGLADIVSVFHASSLHMWHQMNRISFLSAESTIIGPDTVKFGGFYYSGTPDPSSAVYFNEYDDNQLKMQLLFLKRVKQRNTADRRVNTGAALQFALDNMFSPERGARPGVPKYVLLMTDKSSDDDVMGPARRLREAGIKIIVMGMHEGDMNMNRTEFNEMTFNEQGFVYMPDEHVDNVGQGLMDEFFANFCADPCKHVLTHGRNI